MLNWLVQPTNRPTVHLLASFIFSIPSYFSSVVIGHLFEFNLVFQFLFFVFFLICKSPNRIWIQVLNGVHLINAARELMAINLQKAIIIISTIIINTIMIPLHHLLILNHTLIAKPHRYRIFFTLLLLHHFQNVIKFILSKLRILFDEEVKTLINLKMIHF